MSYGIVFILLALLNYVLDTSNILVIGLGLIGVLFIISDLGKSKGGDPKEEKKE